MIRRFFPKLRNITAVLLSLFMVTGLIPAGTQTARADSTSELSNPRILEDSSMQAGQKTTWDCIYFGSYPQTEIVAAAEDCITYGKTFSQESDYIEDSTLFSQLTASTDWDDNNDLILNGTKYRRVSSNDSKSSHYYDWAYNWNSTSEYHYFRYEPIKWRVLNLEGNQAFLLSDITLDAKTYEQYNTTLEKITWEGSMSRSWLNGYDSSMNSLGVDCSSNNFIDSAFSSEEQNYVLDTKLDNTVLLYGDDSAYESNETTDKIFFLSVDEVSETDRSMLYGFYVGEYSTVTADEAKGCKSSTFAKISGACANSVENSFQLGKCIWWLRSSSRGSKGTACCYYKGDLSELNAYYPSGVRPAMRLDLSAASSWSYAGTVCSDGTVVEDVSQLTHTHSFDSTETVKEATCIATGLIKHKCSGCEEYTYEITAIDPDNHEESIVESGEPANCTKDGTTDKTVCTLCGKQVQNHEVIPALGHTEVIDVAAVAPTCTSVGFTQQSHCSVCGETISSRTAIPSLGHQETAINEKPATLKADGNTAGSRCSNCEAVFEQSEVIPRISKVSLSYTTATYSGSVKSPTVKVYDRTGKKLTENTDYVVSRPTGRKNVGVYTYKLTFFGQYEGTVKLTLTINPKGTTISKLTALTKSFKVAWKKNSTQTSGYQLQYSTSGAFKSAKIMTVSGTSNTSKTIKSLKAKTKYYVRIRTYKKVSGKTYYSAWSAKKYVKTK